ncbi:MAG: ASCH domain-containing protein [Oscillospiraceae bacterium]|nr:ASCH domain-containing protein [Oscillospiraceae bacterium]
MLTLPIKRKWFDMIASGEKLEEYRAITPYYASRFTNVMRFQKDGKEQFHVRFRAGYRAESPTMIVSCWLDSGEGKQEWGAEPGVRYYRLHITWKETPKGVIPWI